MGLFNHVGRTLFVCYFQYVSWNAFKGRVAGAENLSEQYKVTLATKESRFGYKMPESVSHKNVSGHFLGVYTIGSGAYFFSSVMFALGGSTCWAFPIYMVQAGKIWMYDMPWKHTNTKDFVTSIPNWILDLALLGLALTICTKSCKKADATTEEPKKGKKNKKQDPLQEFAKDDKKPKRVDSKDVKTKSKKKI